MTRLGIWVLILERQIRDFGFTNWNQKLGNSVSILEPENGDLGCNFGMGDWEI